MMQALETIATARVAILGDPILDVYLQGSVERISPEAPVPVLHWASERSVPGGAANVAANVASLGASVLLLGLAGDDDGGATLARHLAGYPTITSRVIYAPCGTTTVKTRLLSANQQIARIDRETPHRPDEASELALLAAASEAIEWCDVLLISDYGKGTVSDAVLAHVLADANARSKRVIVDPKRSDFSAYRGAWLVTPNRGELARATGRACETDEEVEAAARVLHTLCDCDVLLTRSEKGLSYIPRRGETIHLATSAQDVFDVSGAGDTVVAVLGAAVASGASVADAMALANRAAGIVVGKIGTSTVTPEDLLASYEASDDGHGRDGRLLEADDLLRLRDLWSKLGLKVGFANGCFDLIHPGHISLIRQAARSCDRLIVALNSDSSVRRLKGPTRPVQSEEARADVMGAIKGVDAVVLFAEDTPLELITRLRPDVLIKGADYREDQVVGGDLVKAMGGRVVLAAISEGHSTTALLKIR